MITMSVLSKVKRLFYRERLSISEICRQTSLSRNTVKTWLKKEKNAEPKYVRTKHHRKIASYEPHLKLALQTDAHRPKRDRRTAKHLFEEIVKLGFPTSAA